MKLRGKAWVFDGLLDVDWEICILQAYREARAKWMLGKITQDQIPAELGKYAMTKVDPDFPKKVQKGDFLVGGDGVGYGHDHGHACQSLLGAGVGAVICEATNANFKRNCFVHGLPVAEVKGIKEATRTGDELEVDFADGKVRNLTQGTELSFPPYPDFIMKMLEAGGLNKQVYAELHDGIGVDSAVVIRPA